MKSTKKVKLVWTSKKWSRKEGLQEYIKFNLVYFTEKTQLFNLYWWLFISITQTRDNQIIDLITK